jgi:hypothetical protein
VNGSTLQEVWEEFRGVVLGRSGIADGIIPPLLFVAGNTVAGVAAGAMAGLGSAAAIIVWRLARGRPLRFALAGAGGTLLAVVLALRSGRAEDYFLPGIIGGTVTAAIVVVSILARRPFVAWTSWITRGWPLAWYWHPRVRPAYARASWLWAVFFGVRTLVQWRLYLGGDSSTLAAIRVASGWPALVVLLAATYLLGRRWLTGLEGPSVEEFESGAPPPWKGQPRGF